MENKLIPVIENHNKNLVVSSRVVANQLDKRHDNIIRDIEKILETSNVSSLFITNNYNVEGQNRKYKEYLLTKDGFILYMFNIQGHNDFKMAYINKFNEMETGLLKNRELDFKNKELDIKHMRAEAMLLNAKLRQAKFLESHSKLSPQSASVAVGSGFQPLPDIKYYSASDIAKELGVTPHKIGRTANQNNLKVDKYGIMVLDKSRTSDKQFENFKYNESGRNKLFQLLGGNL
jgi:phage regulatory protein, rha family